MVLAVGLNQVKPSELQFVFLLIMLIEAGFCTYDSCLGRAEC